MLLNQSMRIMFKQIPLTFKASVILFMSIVIGCLIFYEGDIYSTWYTSLKRFSNEEVQTTHTGLIMRLYERFSKPEQFAMNYFVIRTFSDEKTSRFGKTPSESDGKMRYKDFNKEYLDRNLPTREQMSDEAHFKKWLDGGLLRVDGGVIYLSFSPSAFLAVYGFWKLIPFSIKPETAIYIFNSILTIITSFILYHTLRKEELSPEAAGFAVAVFLTSFFTLQNGIFVYWNHGLAMPFMLALVYYRDSRNKFLIGMHSFFSAWIEWKGYILNFWLFVRSILQREWKTSLALGIGTSLALLLFGIQLTLTDIYSESNNVWEHLLSRLAMRGVHASSINNELNILLRQIFTENLLWGIPGLIAGAIWIRKSPLLQSFVLPGFLGTLLLLNHDVTYTFGRYPLVIFAITGTAYLFSYLQKFPYGKQACYATLALGALAHACFFIHCFFLVRS